MRTESLKIRGIEFGKGIPKICVPIVQQNKEAIITYAERILETEPDLIELRIDWFEAWRDCGAVVDLLKELREQIKDTVLLFTMRTKREGGEADISQAEYQALCKRACESGYIDMIDVEAFMEEGLLDKIAEIAHTNQVYVVGSNHDFEKTPDEQEIVRRLQYMKQHGADIPKIAVMPQRERDVLTLLSATLQYLDNGENGPVITMSMNRLGLISRLAGETFGSAVTFAAVEQASAPGQISIEDMRPILEVLHFDR